MCLFTRWQKATTNIGLDPVFVNKQAKNLVRSTCFVDKDQSVTLE